MPFYELIYETGDHSVTEAADDDAVLVGVKNQHERAKSGEVGGPAGNRAERVARVLKYDRHPGDGGSQTLLSTDVAQSRIEEVVKAATDENGVVDLTKVSGEVEPRALVESGPHDSNYTYAEEDELDVSLWDTPNPPTTKKGR